jgi:hypothetical protein
MTKTVFHRFKLDVSSISHEQTVGQHWDLPNAEIFQSKDVATGQIVKTATVTVYMMQ